MENIKEHITRLHNKVQLLLKHMAALEKQNEQHKKEIKLFNEQKELLEVQVKNLQEQNYILKAATSKMSGDDKAALEQTINKYVRDIDKCIGLLSE